MLSMQSIPRIRIRIRTGTRTCLTGPSNLSVFILSSAAALALTRCPVLVTGILVKITPRLSRLGYPPGFLVASEREARGLAVDNTSRYSSLTYRDSRRSKNKPPTTRPNSRRTRQSVSRERNRFAAPRHPSPRGTSSHTDFERCFSRHVSV